MCKKGKMETYVVVEFGCNSSCNDMYPPKVRVFRSKDDAYSYYTRIKNYILSMKNDYDIDYDIYTKVNEECIIQKGEYSDKGAKRPIGIMISNH